MVHDCCAFSRLRELEGMVTRRLNCGVWRWRVLEVRGNDAVNTMCTATVVWAFRLEWYDVSNLPDITQTKGHSGRSTFVIRWHIRNSSPLLLTLHTKRYY